MFCHVQNKEKSKDYIKKKKEMKFIELRNTALNWKIL